MELILLENVEKVGRKGEVVRVRDGYARNFLFPKKLALVVTQANRAFMEDQKLRAEKRYEKEKIAAAATVEKIQSLKVVVEAKAGEQGKLFGSVTSEDICLALTQCGYAFDKKQIVLKESIRALGSYPVTVELYPEVKACITVEVIQKP